MKRSPRRRVRVSMLTPAPAPVCRHPAPCLPVPHSVLSTFILHHGRQLLPERHSAAERTNATGCLLTGLVPFAQDHHHVAAPSFSQRPGDGAPPVGFYYRPARRVLRPAKTSSMIASGSSLRGLSEVTYSRSEAFSASASHQRSLAFVPVTPAAHEKPTSRPR